MNRLFFNKDGTLYLSIWRIKGFKTVGQAHWGPGQVPGGGGQSVRIGDGPWGVQGLGGRCGGGGCGVAEEEGEKEKDH